MYKPQLHSVVWSALDCALLALPAAADSQARIVRLSDVQGTVQINKNSGLGFENAFANLPITQGTELRTRENGRAEIELKEGSRFRLTPTTSAKISTTGATNAPKRSTTTPVVEREVYEQ